MYKADSKKTVLIASRPTAWKTAEQDWGPDSDRDRGAS